MCSIRMRCSVYFILELLISTMWMCKETAGCFQAHELQLLTKAPQIVLLESINNTHDTKFLEDAQSSGLTVEAICSGGIEATIAAAKMFPNTIIINLYVDDFYKFNYNYIKQNKLLYAGDVNVAVEVIQYVTSVQGSDENNYTTCNVNTQELRYVKLVSEAVKDDPVLHDYINEYPNGELRTKKDIDKEVRTVLVCTDIQIDNIDIIKYSSLKIRRVHKKDCKKEIEERQNELLAILSASPFEINYESMIPSVFYQTPYIAAQSTNALSLVASWEPLKYAFLSLLYKMNWQRVAILTDNSAFSEVFQNSLAILFYMKGIVFTLKQCKEFNVPTSTHFRFDCREALKSLKDSDARIVIANVDERNSYSFAEQVADAERESDMRITWLMVHQPFVEEISKHITGDIISIYLTPMIKDADYNKEVNQIYDAIKKITNAYRSVRDYTNAKPPSIKEYRRAFSKALINIRDQANEAGVTAHVSSIYGINHHQIGSIDIKDGEIDENYISPPNPAPDMAPCIIRSNNYNSPCNEKELNLLMMVTVVFMGTFLVVIVYFSETNSAVFRRIHRYRNIA